MNSLKLAFTFCALIFITSGLMAHSCEPQPEVTLDSISNEVPQLSAASAVSLINFNSFTAEKKDSTENSRGRGNINLMELIQTFF